MAVTVGGAGRRATLPSLLLASFYIGAAPAEAATYEPTTRGDHPPNGCSRDDCTLREAVLKANKHSGRDRILLDGGRTYKLRRAGTEEEQAMTGDLDINEAVTIRAAGGRLATVDANELDRVFDIGVTAAADTTFHRLRITGGNSGQGGAIQQTDGSVKLARSRVIGNRGSNNGGAVNIGGDRLTIVKSTIASNRAGSLGGGVHLRGDVVARVSRSTINDNRAGGFGGGIHLEVNASLTVTNSTIANNAALRGGGVDSEVVGGAELRSATVVRNRAANEMGNNGLGGGLYSNGGFRIRNSLIAKNAVGAGGTGPDCTGAFVPQGVNLLTDVSGCAGPSTLSDIVTSMPRISSLADNGGPTETIALRHNSPAINAAGGGSPSRDQRGEKRKKPDIGAFERRPGN